MSDKDNTPKQDKTEKTEKKVYPKIITPVYLFAKARKEGVTIKQLMVYSWFYTKNHSVGGLYCRPSYDLIDDEVKRDLGFSHARDMRISLEKKGWPHKEYGAPYNGLLMKGCRDMLSKVQADKARAVQQEMQLTDEEAVIEVESSVPNYEYIYEGRRSYDDNTGHPNPIPDLAPRRPTATAIWSNDPEGWYEPEDLPGHELEY